VVKANAYGHGIESIVPALAHAVEMFAVASLDEARAVRALAPSTPILLLGTSLPEERAAIAAAGFIPSISSIEEADAFSALAGKARIPVHLKLDTGMGRAGIWHEQAAAAVRTMRGLPGIEIAGIASHLPVPDEDDAFTLDQLRLFHTAARVLREKEGLSTAKVHVCNSAGTIGFPEWTGDLLRVGLALYGSSPRPEFESRLRPALVWKTRVTLVRQVPAGRSVSYGRTFITPRPMRLATLAVGYADGFRRHLSGAGACVLIDGSRCPLVGRVTMDQIVVDATAAPEVEPGDEAELVGRGISAAEHAAWAGTIAWDVFTGLGPRVVRIPA
jgi:alanine racemase